MQRLQIVTRNGSKISDGCLNEAKLNARTARAFRFYAILRPDYLPITAAYRKEAAYAFEEAGKPDKSARQCKIATKYLLRSIEKSLKSSNPDFGSVLCNSIQVKNNIELLMELKRKMYNSKFPRKASRRGTD